jgi:hypothetical protein
LITAGVSHWGAYGLIAGLAVLNEGWRQTLCDCLDPETDRRILETLVERGPAVDGVTLRRAITIDGLDLTRHGERLEQARAVVRMMDDKGLQTKS